MNEEKWVKLPTKELLEDLMLLLYLKHCHESPSDGLDGSIITDIPAWTTDLLAYLEHGEIP